MNFEVVGSAPCMRFCSFSALRMRCSLALLRDLFRKAFGLRFISAVGASSLPLSFFFCSTPQSSEDEGFRLAFATLCSVARETLAAHANKQRITSATRPPVLQAITLFRVAHDNWASNNGCLDGIQSMALRNCSYSVSMSSAVSSD